MSRTFVEIAVPFTSATDPTHVTVSELLTPDDKAQLTALAKGARGAVNVGGFTGASAEAILAGMDGICYSVDSLAGTDVFTDGTLTPAMVVSLFIARTQRFGARSRLYLGDSCEFARLFPLGSADLVFIDAGHSYRACRDDIDAWLPALRPGGIMCGHDLDKELLRWPREEILAHAGEESHDGYHPGVFLAVMEKFKTVTLAHSPDSSLWWVAP